MIRHVVMWKFKESAEGKNKYENMEIVRDSLYSLTSRISAIKKMEIGFDISKTNASMDMLLLTEFDSVEDLKTYATDPEHLRVGEYIKKVVDTRVVHDCEI